MPSKLENQISTLSEHPEADILLEASMFWYSWQEDKRRDTLIPIGTEADQYYPPGKLIYQLYPLCQGAAPVPSAILMRKSALLELGGFEEIFTGHLQLYEDQAFLHKFYLNKGAWVSSSCYTMYRQRQGSLAWLRVRPCVLARRKISMVESTAYYGGSGIPSPRSASIRSASC